MFKETFLKAVKTSNEISRLDKLRLLFVIYYRKNTLKKIEVAATQMAVQMGVLNETDIGENIPWDRLFDFLLEILPIIIEILLGGI